jgi:competence protein ComEA
MFLAIVVVAAVAGGYLGASRRPDVVASATTPTIAEIADEALLEVHVAGAVVAPGVVQVPEGSIVAEAIAAAGGLTGDADPDGINLAARVQDGDQVVVPSSGSSEPSGASPGDGLIAINRATIAELEALPGVGPVLAGRIVAYREEHGPFRAVEDLLDVPGIGESKLASIRDLIRVP